MKKYNNKLNLKIGGSPQNSIETLPASEKFSVHPQTLPFIKAKALVEKGDRIKAGTPLFFDKRQEKCVFVSPQSGRVQDIVYGPRRSLEKIEVIADEKGEQEVFSSEKDPIQLLVKAGLWGAFRQFPFMNIPKFEDKAPYILISLENLDSFDVNPELFVKYYANELKAGFEILKQIAPIKLIISEKNKFILSEFSREACIVTDNTYPSTDPGVVLYRSKRSVSENRAWCIKAHHVVEIGHLSLKGTLKKDRLITVSGPAAKCPGHFLVNIGESVSHILKKTGNQTTNIRLIAGGVFAGTQVNEVHSIAYDDTAITLLDSNYEPEVLSFLAPGTVKASYSKTFLSSLLNPKVFALNDHLNGGYRDCVSCNFCEEVCPVGLDPRTLLREIKGGDVEIAMQQGLLDFVPTGLCSYVCPSKIDLDGEIKQAKDELYEELIK